MYLFVELMVVVLPCLAVILATDYYMNIYGATVDLEKVNRKFESFQAKIPTLEAGKTKYIVTGGAGFIGSWITRFLILRNESDIILLDNNPTPPGDLLKHGVQHIVCDLTDKDDLEKIVGTLKLDSDVTLVVFHAAAIQRYYLSWLTFHRNISDKNVEMVQNLIDVLSDLSATTSMPIYIINIGDAISRRNPISWWKFWNYKSWAQQSVAGSSYVSSFAESKAVSEKLVLEANNGKSLITGSIEPQGIVCGYYGESLLSPCLYYKGALNHCWDIPSSFLHVEDVTRAALLLEAKLRNKTTTTNVQAKSFLVSNGQLMTMDNVFAQINLTTKLRVIKINPALVLIISYGAQLLSMILSSGRNGWQKKDDSLFSGRWWSLTSVRFTTLQLCQIPDKKRLQESKDLLDFEASFTLEDTIQSTVKDYLRIDKYMSDAKKAAEEAAEERSKQEFEKKYGRRPEEVNKNY